MTETAGSEPAKATISSSISGGISRGLRIGAGIVENEVADRSEMRAIILVKPRQSLPVGRQIEGRPLPCPDIAMEASLLRCSRDRGRRGHDCRKPGRGASHSDRARARKGSPLAGPRRGSRSRRVAVRPHRVQALSRSSNKAISQKEGIDVRRRERSERIIGRGHQRFLVVERRVENERHTRELAESRDQRVKERSLLARRRPANDRCRRDG